MKNQEISYEEARQRAERYLREELSRRLDRPLPIPLLEERYADNSVCWIFFRNRTIHISVKEALNGLNGAVAISKWGGFLWVKDNFEDDEELKIQMDRFERIHPAVNPIWFRSVWGIRNPLQERKEPAFYYAEFQRRFDAVDPNMGEAFKAFSSTHNPQEVRDWLGQYRSRLSAIEEPLLLDFYWDIKPENPTPTNH